MEELYELYHKNPKIDLEAHKMLTAQIRFLFKHFPRGDVTFESQPISAPELN
jgi:hypothetical protein